MHNATAAVENGSVVSQNLSTELLRDSSALLLDIHPKIPKAGAETKAHTPVFTAALRPTAKGKR